MYLRFSVWIYTTSTTICPLRDLDLDKKRRKKTQDASNAKKDLRRWRLRVSLEIRQPTKTWDVFLWGQDRWCFSPMYWLIVTFRPKKLKPANLGVMALANLEFLNLTFYCWIHQVFLIPRCSMIPGFSSYRLYVLDVGWLFKLLFWSLWQGCSSFLGGKAVNSGPLSDCFLRKQ